MDPCATARSAKAPAYYTYHDNGLAQPWYGRVFCNPPYADIRPWVEKAFAERHRTDIIVMLLSASTDTKWWHAHASNVDTIRFLAGRVKFTSPEGKVTTLNRLPSVLWVIR